MGLTVITSDCVRGVHIGVAGLSAVMHGHNGLMCMHIMPDWPR